MAPGSPSSKPYEVRDLAYDLRAAVHGEVRFDRGSLALYSTDSSNYRQVPIGVVIPADIDDVLATLACCRAHRVPVLSRGGGTSLAGQCCNVAVVMDFSKHINRLIELDAGKRQARVQPGLVLDSLRGAAYGHDLTFAPDPSTHTHCTLGGMIGNNSCGVHSVMAGRTVDNVIEMDVVTYDGLRMRVGATSEEELDHLGQETGRRGEIYRRLKILRDRYAPAIRARFPRIPRRVSGYNIDALLPENGFQLARALVGCEGTCVTVLEAVVGLVPWPRHRVLLVLGYPSVYHAADHIMQVLAHKPMGLEGVDDQLIENMRLLEMHTEAIPLLPEGNGWLLAEFGGETAEEAEAKAQGLMNHLAKEVHAPSIRLLKDKLGQERMWKVRESGLGATAHMAGSPLTWEGWEDSAVPPHQVGTYLRRLRELLDKYHYRCSLYGHFGDGCIHTRIEFDLASAKGIASYRSFVHEAAHLCLSLGGSLSGEHGDGQSRGEMLPMMFGDEVMQAFHEFKAIWDPDNRMNPGKKINPYRMDENLRIGTQFQPANPETHFKYTEDGGDFVRAVERCVGVGNCRQHEHGSMCPSYMVTREERDSTRGRSRLLFEMLRGDIIKDGWRSNEVKEALDLCLACKACKGECPVEVDMATYKAEFLSHHYKGRLRPRSAYAMGLIPWWAGLGSAAPWLANAITHMPGLSKFAKFLGGIAPQRDVPRFASTTFRHRFLNRTPQSRGDASPRRVLLWTDTFTNHFEPHIAEAAVRVLEAAGFEVGIPRSRLCCGRPLYDYGMLHAAKRLLQHILVELRDDIRAGTPIVVLEPSCLAVFHDELQGLFPADRDAKRLKVQSSTLAGFLRSHAPDFAPRLERKAVLHGHCHQTAVIGMDDEQHMLTRILAGYQTLDAGCCGMAGSFGYERAHYDISRACAERALLPALRESAPGTMIIADGFSCRGQISQLSAMHPSHLAEIMDLALDKTRNHDGREKK